MSALFQDKNPFSLTQFMPLFSFYTPRLPHPTHPSVPTPRKKESNKNAGAV